MFYLIVNSLIAFMGIVYIYGCLTNSRDKMESKSYPLNEDDHSPSIMQMRKAYIQNRK